MTCSLPCKTAVTLLVIAVFVGLSGCSTSGVKNDITTTTVTDPNGTVTTTVVDKSQKGGDIAAMELALALNKSKADTLLAVANMDNEAQRYLVIRGDMWTDEYESYIKGEVAEGEQIRSGLTGGLWGAVGLAGVIGMTKTLQKGYDQAGDTYSTGNISVTKSDDPISGEGGSSGYIGGQSVIIGSGQSGTDFVQQPRSIDKNIQSNFGPEATSNLDDSTEPNRINDADTVKDNGFGL